MIFFGQDKTVVTTEDKFYQVKSEMLWELFPKILLFKLIKVEEIILGVIILYVFLVDFGRILLWTLWTAVFIRKKWFFVAFDSFYFFKWFILFHIIKLFMHLMIYFKEAFKLHDYLKLLFAILQNSRVVFESLVTKDWDTIKSLIAYHL